MMSSLEKLNINKPRLGDVITDRFVDVSSMQWPSLIRRIRGTGLPFSMLHCKNQAGALLIMRRFFDIFWWSPHWENITWNVGKGRA